MATYLHPANFKGNEVSETSYEKLATAPTVDLFNTRTYFNTTDNTPYMYINTVWQSLLTTAVIDDVMDLQADIDCSGNPNYPVAVSGNSFMVTFDGKIGGPSGEAVSKGDLIVCKNDSPVAADHATVGSDFFILERNLEAATDVVSGYVRLATSAEVTAGTSITAVTTVADALAIAQSAYDGNTYSADLAAGSTSYTITHNLGGIVDLVLLEKASGAKVIPGITKTSDNVVTISVNPALGSTHSIAAYKVGSTI